MYVPIIWKKFILDNYLTIQAFHDQKTSVLIKKNRETEQITMLRKLFIEFKNMIKLINESLECQKQSILINNSN